jgi:salicylate hydroxylase
MSPSEINFHVAIIGAGITGVVLALGLQARGVSYTVYERRSPAPQDRVSGAGIGFSPNAERAMAMVHPQVRSEFKRVATPNGEDLFQFVDGYTDNLLFALPVGKDGFLGGLRHDILNAWLKLVEGPIQYDKELVNIVNRPGERIVLQFKDGTMAEADAVIGCDGLHSRVRDLLYPEARANGASKTTGTRLGPRYTLKYCYRALAPMALAVDALGQYRASTRFMYIGHGAHIITYPVGKSELLNVLVVLSEQETSTQRTGRSEGTSGGGAGDKSITFAFADWAPRPRRAAALLEDAREHQLRLRGPGGNNADNDDRWLIFDMAEHPIPRYVLPGGQVCVAGDAAHATAPHLGAGGGMGVEDALVLSELLGEVDRKIKGRRGMKEELVARALESYHLARYNRTQEVIMMTRQACDLFHWRDPEVSRDGEKFAAAIAPLFHRVWDFDLERMVKEALARLDE